mgnify:CR=1 FL=1
MYIFIKKVLLISIPFGLYEYEVVNVDVTSPLLFTPVPIVPDTLLITEDDYNNLLRDEEINYEQVISDYNTLVSTDKLDNVEEEVLATLQVQ